MRDYRYSIEIMKEELENKYISPEIKYAFETSIEALDKQIPKKLTHEATKLNKFTCLVCLNVHEEQTPYCCYCGQKLEWD